MKNDTSPGFDGIPVSVVKKVNNIISKPLCAIFNLSLSTGIVPEKLKIAKVIPVFKKGAKYNVSNYRPISVLPIFSKILEKCMYNRLFNFLNQFNIICNNQFGFRPKHSTSSALLSFIDNVVKSLDNKEVLLSLFLDLSKAFDTLDHSILLC